MMWTNLSQFYTSSEWRRFRLQLMRERVNERGEIICAECGKPIINLSECIGHHKAELTLQNVNDYTVSLNPSNVDLVHLKCHNVIHNRFGGRVKDYQRKIYYVWGAPCSGKSTFVKDNMQRGDIVFDIDKLWSALSGQPEYVKPNEIKSIVFNARNAIFESIKMRAGKWQQAFIIEGGALIGDRKRRIEALGAESIFINATQETCLQRLLKDDKRALVREQWEQYINDWFISYQPDMD